MCFVHRLNVFGSLLGIFRDHLAEGTGKKVSVFLFEEMAQVQGHVQVGIVVKVLGSPPWDICWGTSLQMKGKLVYVLALESNKP